MSEDKIKEMTVEEAVEALKEYKEKTGLSQAKIAKKMNVSEGTVSGFLSGTYKAMESIVPKVRQLIRIESKKELTPKEPEFKMTGISERVINVISCCQAIGKVGVVCGDAGVGKTMAINEYKRKNPDTSVVITINPCFSSIVGVNELLARAFHIQEKVSRKINLEVLNRLEGSNKVIIIDEAQHLTPRVLDYLRSITDQSHTGMVFVGNTGLKAKMNGGDKKEYSQVYSRVAEPEMVLTEDVQKSDIELLFEDFNITGEEIEILYRISHTGYGIRGAVNVILNTIAAFGNITPEGVAKMARRMSII